MKLPHRHQVDFAKRKGNVPYPCFYCMNKSPNIEYITDGHNIVKEFGEEANVPQICNGGIHAPTGHGDCKRLIPVELPSEYKRWYPSSLFSLFTREYMMEMITDINANKFLSRPMLIARAHKGYHTREQRIKEMLDEGIVDVSYDVNCNECYSLTEYGQEIADAITGMLDSYLLIKEHGEIMAYEVSKLIFEFVRNHTDCTAKQVYDYFDANAGYDETVIPLGLEALVMAGYIEPLYNDDFTRIGYATTQKGILRWRALYVDNQV